MKKQTSFPKNIPPFKRCSAAVCCSLLLLFSLPFSGCGRQDTDTLSVHALADVTALAASPYAAPSPETEAIFCQILLLLQDGFRQYHVPHTYQVYFSAPEECYTNDDGNTVMECSLLLKDTDAVGTDSAYWQEVLHFIFDKDSRRYTFIWQYEPVMTQNDSFTRSADFFEVKELLENCIYETTLSQDTVIDAPVQYDAASGPVVSDNFFTTSPYFPVHTPLWLYTYRDERMGVYITIPYPVLYVSDPDLYKILNARIREAFFYGYDWEKEPNLLIPEEMMFTTIDRSYCITREDAQYFSVRIYEYNESRLAAHPNEWESCLTLSMETGNVITLSDIVGETYTLTQLLDSEAFHVNWGSWGSYVDAQRLTEAEKEALDTIRESYQNSALEVFDTDFYLTDDSLGLIVPTFGDEYTCIEANLSDLGLDEWIAANPADK